MHSGPSSAVSWPAREAGFAEPAATGWIGPSALVAATAGFLTAFTISLVGEMPLGEIVLLATAAWAALCAVVHRGLPGPLFRCRYLGVLLACQMVALLAYAVADFYWSSHPRDMARGWGRLVFLTVDILAVAYLFGRSRHNFLWFLAGQLAGDLAHFASFGALFDDAWKFGYGIPLTYAGVLLASCAGPVAVMVVAGGLGALHFAMDFRSVGGICMLLAGAAALQALPRGLRVWALPCGAVVILAVATVLFNHVRQDDALQHRSSRSDVDRTAMIQAAAEAFLASPLIGHGSWFSRSDVNDNFTQIRADLAKEEGVGGFVGPNEEPEDVALHSQILVALAEGGLFGGAFFFAYGAGLAWALWDQVMVQAWRRDRAARVLLLLFASWHLVMSPFSGAHRVYIAMAVGLVVLVQIEWAEKEFA